MRKKNVWVKIKNKGEIELSGIHLMGISSKREDETKIGFFGSGNKYSIALLLREKIPFKIFSGQKEVKIDTEPVMFRGKLYEQIIVNGEKTSLTTAMGPDWEPWFAIREFYCNAVDEGGATMTVTDKPRGEKDNTTIFVKLNTKLEDFFKNINRFILTGGEKYIGKEKTKFGYVGLLERGGEEFIAYRMGIRIFPKNDIKSLFWYNFQSIDINESRTYQYEYQVLERIASFFARTNNKQLIEHYLHAWKGSYEENAKWEYADKLSDMWHQILVGKRVYPENLALRSGDFEGKANSFIVPEKLAEKIASQFDDIEVVGSRGERVFTKLEMTEEEKTKIKTAKEQLLNIGYNISSEVVLAQALTDDVIAWYDKESNIIYHTRRHLNGIAELKNTLLEEHFHCIGHEDGQREFVTFLIDELIKSKENER